MIGASAGTGLAGMDSGELRPAGEEHLPLHLGHEAAGKVPPGGTVTFMTGTSASRPAPGVTVAAIASPWPRTSARAVPGHPRDLAGDFPGHLASGSVQHGGSAQAGEPVPEA